MKTQIMYLFCISLLVVLGCTKGSDASDSGVNPRGLYYESDNSEAAASAKQSSSFLNYQGGGGGGSVIDPYGQSPYGTQQPMYQSYPAPSNNFHNLMAGQQSSEAQTSASNQHTKLIDTGNNGGGFGGMTGGGNNGFGGGGFTPVPGSGSLPYGTSGFGNGGGYGNGVYGGGYGQVGTYSPTYGNAVAPNVFTSAAAGTYAPTLGNQFGGMDNYIPQSDTFATASPGISAHNPGSYLVPKLVCGYYKQCRNVLVPKEYF